MSTSSLFNFGSYSYFKPSPNDNTFALSKLKAFAEYKLHVKKTIPLRDRLENTMGKGENAGNQHFLLFPVTDDHSFKHGCFPI